MVNKNSAGKSKRGRLDPPNTDFMHGKESVKSELVGEWIGVEIHEAHLHLCFVISYWVHPNLTTHLCWNEDERKIWEYDLSEIHWALLREENKPCSRYPEIGSRIAVWFYGTYDNNESQAKAVKMLKAGETQTKIPFEGYIVAAPGRKKRTVVYSADGGSFIEGSLECVKWKKLKPTQQEVEGLPIAEWSKEIKREEPSSSSS